MLIRKIKIPFIQILLLGFLPSPLKKMVYKMKGYRIGKNVKMGFGSVIICKKAEIADHVKLGFLTVLRAQEMILQRYVSIGSLTMIDTGRLRIGEDSRINEQVIVGGLKTSRSSLDLGERSIIMEFSFINTTEPVKIGNDSGIGGHCLLFTHGSWLNEMEGFPVNFAPVTIGNSVWLPWRVFVMPGVTIGDRSIIGANSMVNRSVDADTLAGGSPAREIRKGTTRDLSHEDKKALLGKYITDFTDYLRYHAIVANVNKLDELIEVSGEHNGKFILRFISEIKDNTSFKEPADLIVYMMPEASTVRAQASDSCLVVDLTTKTRVGSSTSGEEFVKFIGRYGIRLKRLD